MKPGKRILGEDKANHIDISNTFSAMLHHSYHRYIQCMLKDQKRLKKKNMCKSVPTL